MIDGPTESLDGPTESKIDGPTESKSLIIDAALGAISPC